MYDESLLEKCTVEYNKNGRVNKEDLEKIEEMILGVVEEALEDSGIGLEKIIKGLNGVNTAVEFLKVLKENINDSTNLKIEAACFFY